VLKTTPPTEYFNIQLIASNAVCLQRNENTVMANKQHSCENNEKLKLETFVRSVGANFQTKISIIIVYELKKAENL